MTLSTKLFILVALFIVGVGLGWHLRGNEDASTTLTAQKTEVKQGNAQNAKDAVTAQAHEAKREKTADIDRGISQQAAVAAAAPDYHTCELKPDDLALLNQAIGDIDEPHK